ncbi:MAG: site-specific DNA-methyltransferase, partial [Atribacterota bacterium]|nr:site-specific DNA-methyltransferase [Atribacterota bacterium]
MSKQKLELTWIGKDEELKLEPRILIEDPKKSYGDSKTENMLIHGDNLLALKALEQDFAGKIKCVYIDPPYNTGSAFEHYDDSLEHSIWLNLMKPRLKLLHSLLRKDGLLWISIDDGECQYLKILCDEVFERRNFVSTVTVRMSTASGVKTSHRERTIIKEKEYLLVYAKDKDFVSFVPQYIPQLEWDDEFQYLLEKNNSKDPADWEIKRLKDVLSALGIPVDSNNDKFKKFTLENSAIIWRRAFIRSSYKELSQKSPDKIIYVKDEGGSEHYYYRGRELYFLKDKLHDCFTEEGIINAPSHLLGDLWIDINTGKLFNEGGVDFRNGKKPEFLIARILAMSTSPHDWVLDSFLGSGTTAAVAHKMNRSWIGIELGNHCQTHCVPRLKTVIDNNDSGGITKSVGWVGGGGLKFYELAPSLLRKDKYGNWVIDEQYNANMLAAAICKHEGFKFFPDTQVYWKQGKSTETDYIFVTTSFVTVEQLDKIHEEMRKGESLLICAKSFAPQCKERHGNITIKKIPQMI